MPIGSRLSRIYGIQTKSSYAHDKGEWYECPRIYPATLWDSHGFKTFICESDLELVARLKIKVNFLKTQPLSSVPGYQEVSESPLW